MTTVTIVKGTPFGHVYIDLHRCNLPATAVCFAWSCWHSCPVTDQPTASTEQSDSTEQSTGTEQSTSTEPSTGTEPSLETLVGSWLTVPDVAERMGIALSAVRRLIEDR